PLPTALTALITGLATPLHGRLAWQLLPLLAVLRVVVAVRVPGLRVAVVNLHDAHAALEQPARQQAKGLDTGQHPFYTPLHLSIHPFPSVGRPADAAWPGVAVCAPRALLASACSCSPPASGRRSPLRRKARLPRGRPSGCRITLTRCARC